MLQFLIKPFIALPYHLSHHSVVTPLHRSISYIKGYHLELLLMNRNLEDIKNRIRPILKSIGSIRPEFSVP